MRGEEIVKARSKIGLTQVELAQVCGVGPSYVSKWEADTVEARDYVDTILFLLDRVDGKARTELIDHVRTRELKKTRGKRGRHA